MLWSLALAPIYSQPLQPALWIMPSGLLSLHCGGPLCWIHVLAHAPSPAPHVGLFHTPGSLGLLTQVLSLLGLAAAWACCEGILWGALFPKPCIRSRENSPLLLASLDHSDTFLPSRTLAQDGGHRRYIFPSFTSNPLIPCKPSRLRRWRLSVPSLRHRTTLFVCLPLSMPCPWVCNTETVAQLKGGRNYKLESFWNSILLIHTSLFHFSLVAIFFSLHLSNTQSI